MRYGKRYFFVYFGLLRFLTGFKRNVRVSFLFCLSSKQRPVQLQPQLERSSIAPAPAGMLPASVIYTMLYTGLVCSSASDQLRRVTSYQHLSYVT
tara:strand:- start:67 stop:351 length:285 start_codon:yes stop_codon:yes gene_type:complete